MGQKSAHGCARRDGIERRGPRIQSLEMLPSGQVGRWAGGSHAVNGDNDVAKMHNERKRTWNVSQDTYTASPHARKRHDDIKRL